MAQLPAEVWVHILGHLSVADKLSVRASCKYFKRLVDSAALWRNWSVVLNFKNGPYHPKFWASLRRRRVSSAVVRSDRAKDWLQLAQSLPALSTVVMEQSSAPSPSPVSLRCLRGFPQLRRVAVRSTGGPVEFDHFTLHDLTQLTHLSLCGVTFALSTRHHFTESVSQLRKLTSLTCHFESVPKGPFFTICELLSDLPELKHLSVSVTLSRCGFLILLNPSGRPRGRTRSFPDLSSLELTGCGVRLLPENMMRMFPGLTRLALFYMNPRRNRHDEWCWEEERSRSSAGSLPVWLRDLPQLSTLVIVRGPPVGTYASYIPPAVTSLTLCVAGLTPEDLAAVALPVPNLLHLHVDPWPSHLGARTADIPRLFPKLRSLKLRHEHVPEGDFLSLHRLRDLQHLEILDDHPRLSGLVGKLRALTQHRLRVTVAPGPRDVLSCPCVEQVY